MHTDNTIDTVNDILQSLADALATAGPDAPDNLHNTYLAALRAAYDLRSALRALDQMAPWATD